MKRYRKKLRKIKLFLILAVLSLLFLIISIREIKLNIKIKQIVKYAMENKIEYARKELDKLFIKLKNNSRLYDLSGFINVKAGKFEEAKKDYESAISFGLKSTNQVVNHTRIGEEYISKGEYNKALIEFSHAILLNPHSGKNYFGLGLSYHSSGNIRKAKENYKKALQRNFNTNEVRRMYKKAIEDERKGNLVYFADRNGKPLTKFNLISSLRTYIPGYVTAHIIGYNDKVLGLENYYKEIIPGASIKLTIDLDLQYIAEQALSTRRGAIVILEPNTGEILAAVSHPTFNPNRLEKDWEKMVTHPKNPLLNRSFSGLYEPGSICKIITLAAFLENESSQIFPLFCEGIMNIEGKIFYDWIKHGNVNDIEQALSESCNISFAKIGAYLGKEKICEYAKKFGFNDKIQLELPVATSTFPDIGNSLYEIAQVSCGLGNGYLITPLHAAMISSAIANDGIIMHPFLVKEIRNITGKVIYTATPKVYKNPIRKTTAEKIKKMMITSVENGTGIKAKVNGITIAGKTGTSGKSGQLNAWFICFFPAEKPKYAISILAEGAGHGMHIAAPIARKIITKIYEKKIEVK
jgi:peptidoglycan glycosyltransferase